MLNYIKSEFYRITNTKGVYALTGILVFISVSLNILIYAFGNQYATTSFSYSNLVANPMLFPIMGAIIAFFLYEGNRRNGCLKNTISSGISRKKVFAGECIVSIVTCTILMVLILFFWILTTTLLLKEAGPVVVKDLILEVPATYLTSIGSVISAILLLELCDKSITGMVTWIVLWFIIPDALLYLGIRFSSLYQAALWIPTNIFSTFNSHHVNMSECITAWDSFSGMLHCVVGGLAGIVLFSFIGICTLKRKDL